MTATIDVEIVNADPETPMTVPTGNGDPAPYGLTKDGKPRGKPGPRPGARAAPPKNRPAGPPPPGRKPGPAKASGRPDYRPGLMGLAQIPMGLLAGIGTRNRKFLADAATCTIYVPPVVEAVNEIAQENEQVAAICERITAIGPWGLVVGPLVVMTAQILVNHGVVPVGIAGTSDPEAIIAHAAGMSPVVAMAAGTKEAGG